MGISTKVYAPVVGTGDMRAAGLPGDPYGAIGSIHRNGRLGGVGFGAR